MCVAYVFMWVCGCEYMCVRVGMWKAEVVAGSLPPSLSVLFLCVHRMHVHSHVCWCTCGCKGTRRSEVDVGCLPPPLSTSCFEDLSLNLDLIVFSPALWPMASGSCSSLPGLQLWGSRCPPRHSAFMWWPGIQTQAVTVVRQLSTHWVLSPAEWPILSGICITKEGMTL